MKSIWTKVALAGVLCVSLGYAADYSEARIIVKQAMRILLIMVSSMHLMQ